MTDSPASILFNISGSAVDTTTGALGTHLATSGSVHVTNQLLNVTGAIGVSSLPPITGAVHITNSPLVITGSVGIGKPVDVTGSVRVENQVSITGSVGIGGPIRLDRGNAAGTPLFVSGSVGIGKPVTVTGSLRVENQLTVTSTGSLQTTLFDAESNTPLAIISDTTASNGSVLAVGITDPNNRYVADVILDEFDDVNRLAIVGKVQTTPPQPPSGTNPVTISADTPLNVSTTESTSYVITSGTLFHVQQIVAGAEGDPSDRGSKISIYFNDGADHIIERIYLARQSLFGVYPDTSGARDGTELIGNGTNVIRVDRTAIQGSAREIDVVIRGFEVVE